MKNKYTDVGIVLGTIADYFRANGGSPAEIDYHQVLTRVVGILEDQAEEIDQLKDRLARAERILKGR